MERIYISIFILIIIILGIYLVFRHLREEEEKKKERMEIEKFENYVESRRRIYKMDDKDIFDIFITQGSL